MMFVLSLVSLLALPLALASPLDRRAASVLSSSSANAFTPYTQFARAAYCNPLSTINWDCGQACSANSGFIPYAAGGDGNIVQFYYIGYWPAQKTAVVAHQGTDPTQLVSDLTDVDIIMSSLDPGLFPNLPGGIQVHQGFADEHALTAALVLSTVKKIIHDHGATSVTLVGHSLGGALALLDTLFIHQNLPTMQVKMVTFGMPRVGNPAFASYISSLSTVSLTRITNNHDLVPIVPGRFLGFSHPVGEVHITNDATTQGSWYSCPGIDDASDSQCEISSVPNVLAGNVIDHLGPYNGIFIGTIFCT